MKIVTAPSQRTMERLGLDPEAGLGESVSGEARRGSMLAWHLNCWALSRCGGTGDRLWLGNAVGLSGHPLAEFRQRLERFEQALGDADPGEAVYFGWEFLLNAGLWRSSAKISSFFLVHGGFEEECARLSQQTGLPRRLAEPVMRSWLASLYRCSSDCEILMMSLHDDESVPNDPAELLARESHAEPLAESEMNAADPLPRGIWRLRKGNWDIAATAEDFEIADSLRQIKKPPPDRERQALGLGQDSVRRIDPISSRTFRDARNIELRGLERIGRERDKRIAERDKVRESERSRLHGKFGDGRPSFQIGRYFSYLLKRIFSR